MRPTGASTQRKPAGSAEQPQADSGGLAGQGRGRKAPCRNFITGECKFGANCRFAHDVLEKKIAGSGPKSRGPSAEQLSILSRFYSIVDPGKSDEEVGASVPVRNLSLCLVVHNLPKRQRIFWTICVGGRDPE